MSSKSEVLSVLESQKGSYISGEALARKLGISRAAVWKAIGELREEGYRITAVTRKGYLLENASDLLSAEAVRLFLRREPGREIICRKLVSSTNQTAKELALSGAPGGARRHLSERAFASAAFGGGRGTDHGCGRSGSLRSGTGALRDRFGDQMGQRPLFGGQEGLRDSHRSRHRF